MAFHSKKEFAAMSGLTTGNLSVYISRGKVILSGEYIDDTLGVNRLFLENRSPKKAMAPKKADQKVDSSDAPSLPAAFTDSKDDLVTLTRLKTQADIDRILSVTELNKLKIERQEGELIPTDLMIPVISQLSQSLIATFRSAMEAMIIEISHKKRLSPAEVADLRTRLLFVINQSIKKGVQEAKTSVRRISDDFSNKKSQEIEEE